MYIGSDMFIRYIELFHGCSKALGKAITALSNIYSQVSFGKLL